MFCFDGSKHRRNRRRCYGLESLESRRVWAADLLNSCAPSHHATLPADVTGEGDVSPRDALAVVAVLADPSSCANSSSFLDVSHDQQVSPLDALLVVSELNQRRDAPRAAVGENGESEGEETTPPELVSIPAVTLEAGSPFHVPLDGSDPDGGSLTYSVSSSRDDLRAELIAGKNLVIDVDGFGKMVFRLFESEAPRVVEQITRLANEGFYDGLKFHRILDDFVLQGGDPNGDGTGGSLLADFADQFDVDLVHNRTGVLSMAKAADDTNNSQFFITEGPQRHLDFNHSIFGQLIEGESVREAISEVAASASGVPATPVLMKSVTVVEDTENGLLRLSALAGATGTGTVTVRVTDAGGQSVERTIDVTIGPDVTNGAPFLQDVSPQVTVFGNSAVIQLQAVDAEGDAPQFSGSLLSGQGTVTVDPESGQVTVQPAASYIGDLQVRVRVRQTVATATRDTFDQQIFTVTVQPLAPTIEGLTAQTDTGSSLIDGLTRVKTVTLMVAGIALGADVKIFQGTTELQRTITTDGEHTLVTLNLPSDGVYELTARQSLNSATSTVSDSFEIEIDSTPPSAAFASVPTTVKSGDTLTGQFDHIDEKGARPIRYRILQGPASATINAEDGTLTWPTAGVAPGPYTIKVAVEDLAGNATTSDHQVTVTGDAVAPAAPTISGLAAESDTGVSSTDGLTNRKSVTLVATGVEAGAELSVFQGTQELESSTTTDGDRMLISVEFASDGVYELSAKQTVGGLTSAASSLYTLEIDTLPPVAPFASVPTTVARGVTLNGQFDHVDEQGARPIRYQVLQGPTGATIDAVDGTLTWNTTGVNPGVFAIRVGVEDQAGNVTVSEHSVTVTGDTSVVPAPTIGGLIAAMDTGASSSDGLTNRTTLTIIVNEVQAGATVTLYRGNTALQGQSESQANRNLVTVELPGDGVYELTARQTLNGVSSADSSSYTLEIDSVPPTAAQANIPATIEEGATLDGDLSHPDEMSATPIRYRLLQAPAAATINAQTGQLTWPSTNAAPGSYVFRIGVEDLAGNVTPGEYSVAVVAAQSAEGANLVEFAQGLASAGVKLYGAKWDVATTTQRDLFEDGRQFLPFVDVTAADRTRLPLADSLDIDVYPTWVFTDGSRLEGVQSLVTIAQRAGITLGGSRLPMILDASNATVLTGSPLNYSLDGYSADGLPLTYTVQSDNPSLLQASVVPGSRAMRLHIEGYGQMAFRLFDQQVPLVTQAIVDQVQAGFYDGLNWYQVNDRWMQTGDPAGLGLGSGSATTFDDQFHADLQHNRPGLLSIPKMVDDGNGSHFMVTQRPQRQMDFHQSLFGAEVEGSDVRTAIGETVTHVGGRTRFPITIENAEIYDDRENGLLLLKPVSGQTGTATVRVTVTDIQGNTRDYSFQVTVVADTVNSSPYLTGYTILENDNDEEADDSIVRLQLTSSDVEGDAVDYFATAAGAIPYDVEVDNATGIVTVHRPAGVTGSLELLVGVGPLGESDSMDRFDRQWLQV